ncbi:glycoside hydrolase family 28 protein [Actinocrinis puniceicyclus]|uniref:Glycoside hydrolase family 28 protein n=1 Tax=Actinocrinis puniceicyclus TaxID=977794 RepID=A0A8J8BCG2_9ACTN|nr:glycoside hydrolase family 28 protein [Actinocrinis puniceicyclus]MBS2963490.1 glycoside hydrolase family 28 protein [Actinocrinis puniceicyclus]
MSTPFDRRAFLRATAAVSALAAVPLTGAAARAATGPSCPPTPAPDPDRDLDRAADAIVRSIRRPRIPRRDFPVTRFGAVADAAADNTAAMAAAIDAAAAAGGGRVVIPAGPTGAASYATGPIHLRSRIELHVEAGATLLFSTDPNAYLPVVYSRWQGIECYNYSPLIYAYGCHDIAVTGGGVLDGQASTADWWSWKKLEDPDFNQLVAQADAGVPVAQRIYGAGYHLPPAFVEPYNCQRVLIQGVTLRNSPFWHLHPSLCSEVTIEGVTVNSTGPNTDGCDPECCDGVLIDAVTFDVGDDCIAIKAGRNTDGRRVGVPSRNIVIQNCSFAAGHGGVTIGSEMTGGVKNVYARDLTMNSPILQSGHRLKTNSVRGGYIENSNVYRVTAGQIGGPALLIDYNYGEGNTGTYPPTVTGITLKHWSVNTAKAGWTVAGYATDHIGSLLLDDITIATMTGASSSQYVDDFALVDVTINGQQVTTP